MPAHYTNRQVKVHLNCNNSLKPLQEAHIVNHGQRQPTQYTVLPTPVCSTPTYSMQRLWYICGHLHCLHPGYTSFYTVPDFSLSAVSIPARAQATGVFGPRLQMWIVFMLMSSYLVSQQEHKQSECLAPVYKCGQLQCVCHPTWHTAIEYTGTIPYANSLSKVW